MYSCCCHMFECSMEKKQQIRPHLTKQYRLPRCFTEVEKILRSVKSCQQNYKTILANSRLRGYIYKKVYSMTVNIIKYYNYIQKIIDKIQLLEKECYLRREIATVLIYELIFGNGFLPGESKVVKTVQKYENDIFYAHEVLQSKVEDSLIIEFNIPRYVRVHTLVTSVPYVIKDLTNYGFHQVIYDNELPEAMYFELVKNLNKGSFLIDFHFKDILVFEHHENLISLDLYKNGHIFLQDKSSYIPVHVLNPQPGDAVLDACAAPGMKTVHIAARMKNKGILIACERDKSRFESLKGMLDCGSVKICKTFCKDFKLIDPSDPAYSNIEYILLDPSCSGSGMVSRMDEVTDTENSKNTERLMKLAGFQIILLKHCLKFPSVKRVVYSTCSIHEEENEYVVHEALNAFSGMFKLAPAMPEWSHRGSEKFEFGKLCLRTDPKAHLTNGFFVAVFERIGYDDRNTEECQQNYQVSVSSSFNKQKRKSLKSERNLETTHTQDYVALNLKHEYNFSHGLRSDLMNDNLHASLNKNAESYVQSADCKQEQIKEMIQKEKNKKKEKIADSNENNERFAQNADCEQEQNVEYFEEVIKRGKKKKKEKITESNENNEYFAQNANCEQEQNVEYFEEMIKRRKKKKKDKFRKSNENNECFAQNTDCEQEQNVEYFEEMIKQQKKKKKEKLAESEENENNESFAQNVDFELLKNMEYAQLNKEHKRREKSNENFYESKKNKNDENSAQNTDCELEKNVEYFERTIKKQKKKKKEKSNENSQNESYSQSIDCELLKNMEYTQNINKKQKKKKKSNECFDQLKDKNGECSAQNTNCELEKSVEYFERTIKKQKKERKI